MNSRKPFSSNSILNMKVYVIAPANFKTGGTELAHQLVKTYADAGVDVTIAYEDIKKDQCPLNEAFLEYTDRWVDANEISDECNHIIIVPEIHTEKLLNYKKAVKIIWWMSVDGFEKYNGYFDAIKYYGMIRPLVWCLKGTIHSKWKSVYAADLHLYQSEYARLWLQDKKINNTMRLSDYINDSYFKVPQMVFTASDRKKHVLYNPKKGYEFTKKIIQASPQFEWIPIQNMTTQEVGELLRSSRVYIDFGGHPGKDRFPREAAISGCCIITGMKGSAKNDTDICIPAAYKFQDKKSNIKRIIAKIQECIDHYEECVKDFEIYRSEIRKDKEQFRMDAMDILERIQSIKR